MMWQEMYTEEKAHWPEASPFVRKDLGSIEPRAKTDLNYVSILIAKQSVASQTKHYGNTDNSS